MRLLDTVEIEFVYLTAEPGDIVPVEGGWHLEGEGALLDLEVDFDVHSAQSEMNVARGFQGGVEDGRLGVQVGHGLPVDIEINLEKKNKIPKLSTA